VPRSVAESQTLSLQGDAWSTRGGIQAEREHSASSLVLVYQWEWGQTTIVNSSFAKLTALESPTTKNNVRFAGRDEYTVLGDVDDTWYNNRARAYRSGWGRFDERDPAVRGSDVNLYAYVDNAPIASRDPFGLHPVGPLTTQQAPQVGPQTGKTTCRKPDFSCPSTGSICSTVSIVISKAVPKPDSQCFKNGGECTITLKATCAGAPCEQSVTVCCDEAGYVVIFCNGVPVKLDLSQSGTCDGGNWGQVGAQKSCDCATPSCVGGS
jgi:RHS repeat-associated protein